jgi:signal transduction histidine kinase/ligand-binding sensor domain-containing protein/DNA-binding response OmpR family regulator
MTGIRNVISTAIIFSLLCTVPSIAQFSTQNVVKHYDLKDGLSQGVVNSIAEDSQSFIWLATDDGLNRFDGYNFKIFKQEKGAKNAIIGNFVSSIFKDRDGTLWVSSRLGLQKFDPDRESFEVYQHGVENGLGTSHNDVSYITEGTDNNLWLALYANGFASFNKSTKLFRVYNPANLPILSSIKTMCLLDDSHGLLWVGSQDGGLNVFNIKGEQVLNKVDELSNPPELLEMNVKSIVKDHNDNVWIGTPRGLVVYLRDRNAFFNFNFNPSFGDMNINSIFADSNDVLWVASQSNGIYRLDLRQMESYSSAQLKFVKIATLHDSDLSTTTFQTFYEDSNKNIWAGTLGNGVYMISNKKERFIKFQKLINKGSTVASMGFTGMCHDRDGNLWLGTNGHGIYRKSMHGNSEAHYRRTDGSPGGLGDDLVLSALCDSEGRLWFGTYAHGIFEFNKANNSFKQYKYDGPPRTGANDVRVMFEDSKNRIWVGTNRGGLCLLTPGTGTYSTPSQFKGILRDGDIRSIIEDKAGDLWLGSYGDGLYKFSYDSKSLVPYFQNKAKTKDFIESRIMLALNRDESNRIWIGTADDGVFIYDPDKSTLQNITEEQGLGNNTIYSIQISRNAAWVSTNSGISKIEITSNNVVNYKTVDGLQDGQFNPASGLFNTVAGYMCFGGNGGLNVFYPDQLEDIDVRPKVLITGLQLFNKPVSIRDTIDGRPILRQAINKTPEIILPHDQSVITFEFIGINYSFPEKINYAYKLESLDKSWNFVGGQRSATYRYLEPGKYEFRVKASSQSNRWGEDYSSVLVTINPPAWRTSWAYGAYGFAALILGLIAYKVSRKQLSLRRRLRIEKAQRKHERRMAAEKLTFFTEISHEFRTPLTLIMGPIVDMLSKEDGQSANTRKLQMVHRNATKLLNLINKLIDYRKIENGNVVLKVKEADIVSFMKEIFESFQGLAAERNISYRFLAEAPSIQVLFDHERMEMVFNNILSNAFKYIGQGNDIVVHVGLQISKSHPAGRVVIKVKDNGIGIPRKYLGTIFDWFHKGDNSGSMNSGIGLSLARKIVHLHKGEIYVESSEGNGSTFSVKLPLGKDHFTDGEITVLRDIQNDTEHLETITDGRDIETDETPAKRGHPGVLVIEDDEDIRLFLREYFEGNYRILEASNGNDGLEMANTFHPDLIISDIMMPGKDGIEICSLLKNNIRTSHIPIILLSAKASLNDHKKGIETGADAYITKPFSPDILSLTVGNLLQSRNHLMRFYRNLFIEDSGNNEAVTKAPSPDEIFLQAIFDHLKANIEKSDFNIAELSDRLNMSRSLVYKKIKMLTGLSPTEYIRSLRLQEAAKLLRTHKFKVFEVVYMVGFSDLKYFRECFSKEYGVPPSEYMKAGR